MNKNKRNLIIIAVIIAIISTFAFTMASVGTTSDPLITLSYLEMRLAEIETSSGGSSSLFEVIEVGDGDILLLGKSTEVILRAGIAKTFVSDRGGLADVTQGRDLIQDETVPKNHLIICPLDDGRGVVFESTAWIMVKGEYTLYSGNK